MAVVTIRTARKILAAELRTTGGAAGGTLKQRVQFFFEEHEMLRDFFDLTRQVGVIF